MRRPWMPLYIADYLADTAHLGTLESGAYLHLIMHYWLKDGLPDDDAQLARITKLSLPEWRAIRPTISALFGEGWSHARIDKEIREADMAYERRSSAGKRSGEVRRKRPTNNVQTMPEQSQPQSPKEDHGGGARARDPAPLVSREAIAISNELLVIAGHDLEFVPPGWCGAPMRVMMWMAEPYSWSRDAMLAGARAAMARKTDGPPSSINYFEKPISRAVAQLAAPVQTVEVSHAKSSPNRAGQGWREARDDFRSAHAELGASIEAAERADDRRGEGDEAVARLPAPAGRR